ncbi:hypothetical protein ACFL59_15990 [Planctomycetota bacterium]
MSEAALREIFAQLESNFQEGALDRDISYYFSFGDGPAEKWTVRLGPQVCEVREGKHIDQADCVVKTTSEFLLKIISDGYVPGIMDFVQGKIKSNDPFLLKDLKKAIGI